jgi:hypothetical protein
MSHYFCWNKKAKTKVLSRPFLQRLLARVTGSFLLLLLANYSLGQGGFGDVELAITPVAGNVYLIQRPGGGGNIGVQVGPDGVLLVDSLFAPLTDRLVEAVKQVTDE